MSSSTSTGEDSPDWLRSFQAPTQSALTLSSGSDDEDEISIIQLFHKERPSTSSSSQLDHHNIEPGEHQTPPLGGTKTKRKRKRKGEVEEQEEEEEEEAHSAKHKKTAVEPISKEQRASEKQIVPSEPNHSVWALSSDSESLPDSKPVSTDLLHDAVESSLNQVFTVKEPKKKPQKRSNKLAKAEEVNENKNGENAGDMDLEEKTAEKGGGLYVSSSRLPLVLVEKVQRMKALVECEGDSIDLSGDVGAVGRVVISDDSSGNHEMLLDLKGTIYTTSILPSRTFCVVGFGQSEAKIEAIMDDFIQLKPQANVHGAETMVEGTLDGFSFDSEDEVDNVPKPFPANQGEGDGVSEGEQSKGKTKLKAGKALGAVQKKIKAAGGKKVKKKSQGPKKSKTKK